jgi:hypothetical protein
MLHWAFLNQAVLFAHVVAFAMTLAAVLREDLRWLRGRRIDAAALRRTVRTVSQGLVVLWLTGLVLVAFAASAATATTEPWVPGAKLCAKLVVVSVLSLNGWALHRWVLPGLLGSNTASGKARPSRPEWPVVLGAVSSASWLYAAFVGVARPLAPVLSFAGFMALYGLGLGLALVLAGSVWRARGGAPLQATTHAKGAAAGRW